MVAAVFGCSFEIVPELCCSVTDCPLPGGSSIARNVYVVCVSGCASWSVTVMVSSIVRNSCFVSLERLLIVVELI